MPIDQKQKIQRKRSALAVLSGGIAILTLGYFLLSKGSDTLAPVLIIASFVTLASGIWLGWD
jgi:uncharacterized membrane protein YidH (DUF202 family)